MNNYWLNEYTNINKGDGYHFERFISELYAEYYEVDIKLNGKSNDKGVDLIINNKIGIQAKYYSTSLGIKPIQEIYAGINYYGLDKGLVITNSSYNSNAIEFAERIGIELIDGNDILVMINRLSMGKKSPEIEKKEKLKENQIIPNEKESINVVANGYKTKKLYTNLDKASKFEKKINEFNNNRRAKYIESLEEVFEIASKNELLYKQVFSKYSFIDIFEVDESEKQTKIPLTISGEKLNPQLKEANYLYPPVNEKLVNEYLEILKLDISDEEKIKKIKKKQLLELILIITIICVLVLILIFLIFLLFKVIL